MGDALKALIRVRPGGLAGPAASQERAMLLFILLLKMQGHALRLRNWPSRLLPVFCPRQCLPACTQHSWFQVSAR
jgi:hypothetical protein